VAEPAPPPFDRERFRLDSMEELNCRWTEMKKMEMRRRRKFSEIQELSEQAAGHVQTMI
jgi:hypothetical protein